MISDSSGPDDAPDPKGKREKVVLTKAQWNQMMVRSLRGETDAQLSQAFGVGKTAIRMQRQNNPAWAAGIDEIRNLKEKLAEAPKTIVKVERGTLSIKDIVETHPQLIANFAHGKIREAIEGETLPAIESWSDLKIAIELVRKACGMDDKSNNIQVNMWGGGQSRGPRVMVDAAAGRIEVDAGSNEPVVDDAKPELDADVAAIETE